MFVFALTAQANIVINEFLPNPDGADGGQEFVELYNTGGASIDISGWALEAGTSSFGTKHTFDVGTVIPAGGYYVVADPGFVGADVNTASNLSLGNAGGTSGDAVRIVDGGGFAVDTVVYGPDNSDGWIDDTGVTAVSLAPTPLSGISLARVPNGTDTDTSAADFANGDPPTPGAENTVVQVTCSPVGDVPGIAINELVPNPSGADAGNEWVELYWPSGGSADLSGWVIASGTQSYSALGALPSGTSITGGQYLVVGQDAINPVADVLAPGFSLGNASNADAVQLRDCFGNPVDTVVYGTDNSDGWLDDFGGLAALAPVPGDGESLLRIPDGADSGNSSVDFQVGFSTPGGSNTAPPPDCGGLASGLLINELASNPEGPDEGAEWIELFHAGTQVIDLEGWQIQSATSESWGTRFTFDSGVTIAPGELLLMGGPQVPGSTWALSGSIPNGSGGDGVRIVDCAGFPADVVVYGGVNEDGITDESGAPASSVAPTPPEGGSIQRVQDGYDTNQSGLDFAVANVPTPGEPNIPIAPIACEPNTGALRINEILPDPEGADDGLEWIEIYNTGLVPARLDGWSISAGTSDYSNFDITFPGGILVQSGQFFVVGGDLVPEASYTAAFSLGNGSTSRDGVRLFDCEGATVDTVVYGTPDELDPDVGIVDDNDQLSPTYGEPGSNQAVYRIEDGFDSDRPEDWAVGRPTPGATNVVDFGPGVPTDPVGCGCGGGPPEGNAPDGEAPANGAPTDARTCSSVPRPFGLLALVLGLVALRRR